VRLRDADAVGDTHLRERQQLHGLPNPIRFGWRLSQLRDLMFAEHERDYSLMEYSCQYC
jgi:hypothetical protein